MMKIAYCSDLHLEFEISSKRSNIPKLLSTGLPNTCNAKVLILAGDIICSEFIKHGYADAFFHLLSQQYESILYVFGNHEYYKGYFTEDVEIVKSRLSRWQNIHVLDGNYIEIDGISFFGATLWTNFKNEDPNVMYAASRSMNDYNCIMRDSIDYYTISPDDILNKHKLDLIAMKNVLSKNNPAIVISHHAPSLSSIYERYKTINNACINYCYYSDLDYLFYDYPSIIAWFHGHCHNNSDYMINNSRILCNPRGYIGQELQANTFNVKYFDVDM